MTETDGAGNDYLDFGATIWNAGPGPFVVEGFRSGSGDTMPRPSSCTTAGTP